MIHEETSNLLATLNQIKTIVEFANTDLNLIKEIEIQIGIKERNLAIRNLKNYWESKKPKSEFIIKLGISSLLKQIETHGRVNWNALKAIVDLWHIVPQEWFLSVFHQIFKASIDPTNERTRLTARRVCYSIIDNVDEETLQKLADDLIISIDNYELKEDSQELYRFHWGITDILPLIVHISKLRIEIFNNYLSNCSRLQFSRNFYVRKGFVQSLGRIALHIDDEYLLHKSASIVAEQLLEEEHEYVISYCFVSLRRLIPLINQSLTLIIIENLVLLINKKNLDNWSRKDGSKFQKQAGTLKSFAYHILGESLNKFSEWSDVQLQASDLLLEELEISLQQNNVIIVGRLLIELSKLKYLLPDKKETIVLNLILSAGDLILDNEFLVLKTIDLIISYKERLKISDVNRAFTLFKKVKNSKHNEKIKVKLIHGWILLYNAFKIQMETEFTNYLNEKIQYFMQKDGQYNFILQNKLIRSILVVINEEQIVPADIRKTLLANLFNNFSKFDQDLKENLVRQFILDYSEFNEEFRSQLKEYIMTYLETTEDLNLTIIYEFVDYLSFLEFHCDAKTLYDKFASRLDDQKINKHHELMLNALYMEEEIECCNINKKEVLQLENSLKLGKKAFRYYNKILKDHNTDFSQTQIKTITSRKLILEAKLELLLGKIELLIYDRKELAVQHLNQSKQKFLQVREVTAELDNSEAYLLLSFTQLVNIILEVLVLDAEKSLNRMQLDLVQGKITTMIETLNLSRRYYFQNLLKDYSKDLTNHIQIPKSYVEMITELAFLPLPLVKNPFPILIFTKDEFFIHPKTSKTDPIIITEEYLEFTNHLTLEEWPLGFDKLDVFYNFADEEDYFLKSLINQDDFELHPNFDEYGLADKENIVLRIVKQMIVMLDKAPVGSELLNLNIFLRFTRNSGFSSIIVGKNSVWIKRDVKAITQSNLINPEAVFPKFIWNENKLVTEGLKEKLSSIYVDSFRINSKNLQTLIFSPLEIFVRSLFNVHINPSTDKTLSEMIDQIFNEKNRCVARKQLTGLDSYGVHEIRATRNVFLGHEKRKYLFGIHSYWSRILQLIFDLTYGYYITQASIETISKLSSEFSIINERFPNLTRTEIISILVDDIFQEKNPKIIKLSEQRETTDNLDHFAFTIELFPLNFEKKKFEISFNVHVKGMLNFIAKNIDPIIEVSTPRINIIKISLIYLTDDLLDPIRDLAHKFDRTPWGARGTYLHPTPKHTYFYEVNFVLDEKHLDQVPLREINPKLTIQKNQLEGIHKNDLLTMITKLITPYIEVYDS